MTAPDPGPSAIRKRRERDRIKRGVMLVTLEVCRNDLDSLESAGLIGSFETDTDVINNAVRKALDEWRGE